MRSRTSAPAISTNQLSGSSLNNDLTTAPGRPWSGDAMERWLPPVGASTTESGSSPEMNAGLIGVATAGTESCSGPPPAPAGACEATPATPDEWADPVCGAVATVPGAVCPGADVGGGVVVPVVAELPGVSAAVVAPAALHGASHALDPGLGFCVGSPHVAPASTAWKRTWIASCLSPDSRVAENVTPGAPGVSSHDCLPPQQSVTGPLPVTA